MSYQKKLNLLDALKFNLIVVSLVISFAALNYWSVDAGACFLSFIVAVVIFKALRYLIKTIY